MQAITIDPRYYDNLLVREDFIKRYIFPGSFIPSMGVLRTSSTRAGLRLADVEDLTPHYAETLRRWRANFFANIEAVRMLGYSDELIRLWEYYLCYCEAGFEEGTCGDVQLMLAKPRRRRNRHRDNACPA